jgi:hypothetical protein
MSAILLDAVTATGSGTEIRVDQVKDHSIQVVFTGSITALTVDLEATLDNNKDTSVTPTWTSVGSHTFTGAEITAKASFFTVTSTVLRDIRLNVTALTGSGTITGKWYGDQITARQ